MKRVFSAKELNAVGKQTGFCKRERDIVKGKVNMTPTVHECMGRRGDEDKIFGK